MKVSIPPGYKNEKRYVFDILFSNYLGLDAIIENGSVGANYEIFLNNGSVIEIEDHFFSRYTNSTYLVEDAIPRKICYSWNDYSIYGNLPVLYGSPEMFIIDESNKKAKLKFDLVAGIYFFLTRWEEYVVKKRDAHGRFPVTESFAYKFDCHKRPVVDEYTEFLWKLISCLDPGYKRTQRNFDYYITHDIDSIRCPFPNLKSHLKQFIREKDILQVSRSLFLQAFKNPFDSFEYLMRMSENINKKSIFYFMSGGSSHLDFENYTGTILFNKRIKEIRSRGHVIGLHPSYNSYNDPELMFSEKKKLEELTGEQVNEVRQHYLRLDLPITSRIQSDCGFATDSSIGYIEDSGFRCGTCHRFRIFDFRTSSTLTLVERPLIFMEGSLIKYRMLKPEEVIKEVFHLIDTVRLFNGEFTLLWHNTSFDKDVWLRYKSTYKEILTYLNGR